MNTSKRFRPCLEELEKRMSLAVVVTLPDATEVVILSASSVVVLPPLRPLTFAPGPRNQPPVAPRVPRSSFVQLVPVFTPIRTPPLPPDLKEFFCLLFPDPDDCEKGEDKWDNSESDF
jgi:hypothetical protein